MGLPLTLPFSSLIQPQFVAEVHPYQILGAGNFQEEGVVNEALVESELVPPVSVAVAENE
jgi:hypothetical protein